MASLFRRIMDGLYWASAGLAGAALVLISVVIPYSVYTRYVLNRAASWPEPAAILLSIVLTFFGAAVCYRDRIHMRMMFFTTLMPGQGRRLSLWLAEALTAVVSGFMVVWGYGLCAATWHDLVAEFPSLSVGVTYLPIPIGGAVTLLFVIERLTIGEPANIGAAAQPAAFD